MCTKLEVKIDLIPMKVDKAQSYSGSLRVQVWPLELKTVKYTRRFPVPLESAEANIAQSSGL
jgi:hypothetical protein